MALERLQAWLTVGLGPSVSAIIFAALVALTMPLLLHYFFYRSKDPAQLPTFLLIGPSGSGKTSLMTLFERGKPSMTHTSQAPLTVEVALPDGIVPASAQYRSVNDSTNSFQRSFLLADTPGHGKLRRFATKALIDPQNLRGVIFLVDATSLSPTTAGDTARGLTETAEYLHDTLLLLQKRQTQSKSSKGPADIPVLVAANKQDLFSSLPVKLVKSTLEQEITNLRNTRSKGLQDSGIEMDNDQSEERDWLGEYGGAKFEFSQMQEFNVPVEFAGGNVAGTDDADVANWWRWIASQM